MKEQTMYRLCCITDNGDETCGMWQPEREHLDEICEARNTETRPFYLYVDSFDEVVARSKAMMKDIIRRAALGDFDWTNEIPF